MPDDHDHEIPPNLALYHGEVVDNADPLRIGRVKVRIGGLIDERSAWAFPMATVGGGAGSSGFFAVPKVGADVGVWFKNGDEDHPFYVTGPWAIPEGQNQAPEPVHNVAPEDVHKIQVFESDRWRLVFDNREAAARFAIVDKQLGTNVVEFDGVQQGLTIRGTIGINIESPGTIRIRGTNVEINGRPVAPISRPI